jgi:hypothetical protein
MISMATLPRRPGLADQQVAKASGMKASRVSYEACRQLLKAFPTVSQLEKTCGNSYLLLRSSGLAGFPCCAEQVVEVVIVELLLMSSYPQVQRLYETSAHL